MDKKYQVKILSMTNPDVLGTELEKWLSSGFELVGGVVVNTTDRGSILYTATLLRGV